METNRKKKYAELEECILDSISFKKDERTLNQDNILLMQDLSKLPFGESHYALPYLYLFKHLEQLGKIKQGDQVYENTSGSAGRAFIELAKLLEFNPHVAIPDGGEKARLKGLMDSMGSNYELLYFDGTKETIPIINKKRNSIIITPKEKYVNGFMDLVKPLLIKNLRNGTEIKFLNHSQGRKNDEINEAIIKGFSKYAKLAKTQAEKLGLPIDLYMAFVGNGSSLYGPAREFAKSGIKTYAAEPAQAALAFDLLKKGVYKELFGIEPGTLPRSRLPGGSFSIKGEHIPVPHISTPILEGLVEDILLISDRWTNKDYQNELGESAREYFFNLARWDLSKYEDAGRTTRAALAGAKELAKEVSGKNFLILKYDTMDKYDDQI